MNGIPQAFGFEQRDNVPDVIGVTFLSRMRFGVQTVLSGELKSFYKRKDRVAAFLAAKAEADHAIRLGGTGQPDEVDGFRLVSWGGRSVQSRSSCSRSAVHHSILSSRTTSPSFGTRMSPVLKYLEASSIKAWRCVSFRLRCISARRLTLARAAACAA
jgi:hypothetical protein